MPKQPQAGSVKPGSSPHSLGIISPNGEVFPIEFSLHSEWIIKYYDWLTKNKRVNLPDLNIIKDMDVSDARNLLVNSGWVPFFGSAVVTAYYRNLKTAAKLVLEAMQLNYIPRGELFMASETGEEQEFNYGSLEEYVEKFAIHKSVTRISSRDSV